MFLVPGILWAISISILSKWKHYRLFFVINTVLFISYLLYLIYGNLPFNGHDEYGIQRISYIIFVPTIHVIVNFFLAVLIRLKTKKSNFHTNIL